MERETGYEDGEVLTLRCRQCGETVAVDDVPQADGPFVCDPCVRETVNRASRTPLSVHIFETAVEMARVRR